MAKNKTTPTNPQPIKGLKGLIILMAITLNLVVLSTAIYMGSTDQSFYASSFEQLNALEKTGLSPEDLSKVTKRLVDYVGLRTSEFSEQVTIDGQSVDFFNDKERAHMVDVKNLFQLNAGIGLLAGAVFIVTLKITSRRIDSKQFDSSVLIGTSVMTLGVGGVLGLLMMTDFSSAFIAFHKLFFTNDLWLLDPATDRMIVLLEEAFFFRIAGHIVWYYIVVSLVMGFLGMWLRNKHRILSGSALVESSRKR